MIIHTLQLATEPFNAIVGGQKTIESRLYDEKRRSIQLGDKLVFINQEQSDQTVDADVIGLLRYETFYDLFTHNEPTRFGGPSVEWLERQINEFYSIDAQKKNGVIGIEFKLSN